MELAREGERDKPTHKREHKPWEKFEEKLLSYKGILHLNININGSISSNIFLLINFNLRLPQSGNIKLNNGILELKYKNVWSKASEIMPINWNFRA